MPIFNCQSDFGNKNLSFGNEIHIKEWIHYRSIIDIIIESHNTLFRTL